MKELPPIIPSDPITLQKAIMVLGHRAQNIGISKKLRKSLVELIGDCPESIEQALRYKQALKKVAKWEAEDRKAEQEETPETRRTEQDAEEQVAMSLEPKALFARQLRVRLLERLQKESLG